MGETNKSGGLVGNGFSGFCCLFLLVFKFVGFGYSVCCFSCVVIVCVLGLVAVVYKYCCEGERKQFGREKEEKRSRKV